MTDLITAIQKAIADICAARLCEVNSMSSRQEMLRLMIQATDTLRAALAHQEQEPVAFADRISFDQAMKSGKGHDVWPEAGDYEARTGRKLRVLYTTPPRREWQGLTEEEILPLYNTTPSSHAEMLEFARAVEAALKEKNQ
jgi:hypothetical protein